MKTGARLFNCPGRTEAEDDIMGARARFVGLAGLTALLGACAGTPGTAPSPMAAASPDKGYLPEARLFQLADAVPPPPT